MTWLLPDIVSFISLTLVLGGAAAFVSGRALADRWRAPVTAILAAVPLAGAVRFLHYALAGERSGPAHFALTFAILAAIALTGFRWARARQTRRQYPWLA
jgi:hypothetical protein